jgi:hypothetical protein
VGDRHAQLGDTGPCGFRALIGALELPTEFDLNVRVLLANGERVPVAAFRGSRAELRTSHEPQVTPLLLTTMGRSGSNFMLSLLKRHPLIATYRPFEYETAVAAYWIGVLRTLADPSSYVRQISGASGVFKRDWWLARELPAPAPLADEELGAWLGGEAVSELAELCQRRIETLYRRIAREVGRPDAVLFAEKQKAHKTTELMLELYPEAKEVFLVRDFRDVACSRLAYGTKEGLYQWADESPDSLEQRLASVGHEAKDLASAWRRRSDRSHVVRYEDLVRQPEQTLTALWEYLGLGGEPIPEVLEGFAHQERGMSQHRTTSTAEQSIGRWRKELASTPEDVWRGPLGVALSEFGYSPD